MEEIKEHMQNCIDREESCLLNTNNTKKLLKEIERLHSIIKEVRELRKRLSFEYYDNGLEVGVNCVIEDLDKILGVDKE